MVAPVVVKCGGNDAVDAAAVCAGVGRLVADGQPVLLVHGGSGEIRSLAERLGVEDRRLVSPDGVSTRHTDDATLEVVTLALAGAVKPRLLTALAAAGVRAVGMTGLDGAAVRARRKKAHRAVVDGAVRLVRDDHSGRVSEVDASLFGALLDASVVPVLSPPILAEDGRPVNADADRVAAAVAASVGASTLILLTGAPGVLGDPADESSVLPECAVPHEGPPPFTGGGMGLKLVAAREALRGGVARVLVADGRVDDPVGAALGGAGTEIVLEDATVGATA